MLAALEGMIAELRQIGVPISLSEKIDAVRSLQHLPLAERDGVKSALRAVLVKSHDHELAFDALFDLYFSPSAGSGSPKRIPWTASRTTTGTRLPTKAAACPAKATVA